MVTRCTPAIKAKGDLEACREEKTSSELESQHQVRPGMIRNWKGTLVKDAPEFFNGKGHSDRELEQLMEQLIQGCNLRMAKHCLDDPEHLREVQKK